MAGAVLVDVIARVVDFPEPLEPVTSIRPRFFVASSDRTGGIFRDPDSFF